MTFLDYFTLFEVFVLGFGLGAAFVIYFQIGAVILTKESVNACYDK